MKSRILKYQSLGGFVKTKIHNETLESINNDHYAETKRRLKRILIPFPK